MKKILGLITQLEGKRFEYAKSASKEIVKLNVEDITLNDAEILKNYNAIIDGDAKYPHLISIAL